MRGGERGRKECRRLHGRAPWIDLTSTGLLFVATTDGKVRAHDEETGKILWTATLPAGSEGLPSMYK